MQDFMLSSCIELVDMKLCTQVWLAKGSNYDTTEFYVVYLALSQVRSCHDVTQ